MLEKWKKGFVMIAFFSFVFVAVNQSGSIAHYIAAVKPGSALSVDVNQEAKGHQDPIDPTALTEKDRALYERITKEAEALRIPPIDAKLDPVWKAIPGVNGQEIDIDRTFKLALEKKSEASLPFIYKEIPIQSTLDDLGPQPIYKGNPRKPMVSLMINVAWKEENIPGMLKTLQEENVKATFFFLGSWLKEHPDMAKQIAAEGHELANHAYWHKTPLNQLSDAAVRKELEDTQKLLSDLGVQNTLFSPPSGDYNMNTVRVASELGMRTILWSLDTIDWKEPPSESIVRKVAARIEPGSLILMHPTASASGALQGMIQEAKRKGLVLGTVTETISPTRVPVVETLARF
jgi:probable sporulation protein (polysaccharide deacetylase family)